MAKTKYTAGPWEIGNGTKLESVMYVYCDDATGSRVADCTATYTPLTKEEKKANAQLIAAAPELLEALQELLKPMDGILSVPGNEVKITYTIDMLNKAKAAIAKALGNNL